MTKKIIFPCVRRKNTLDKDMIEGTLTNITAEMLKGVTTIRNYGFAYMKDLKTAVIPESVTTISSNAFSSNTSMESVTILATTPPYLGAANAFQGASSYPIYVPAESVDAYKAAQKWSSLASRIFAIEED